MTIVDWSNKVNTRFFGFSDKPKDNTTVTQYVSGRVVGWQNNTRNVMTMQCSLKLTKKELAAFWDWYNDELGALAGVFTCGALGDKHYRFTDIPDPQDTEQTSRVLSLSIEEVY